MKNPVDIQQTIGRYDKMEKVDKKLDLVFDILREDDEQETTLPVVVEGTPQEQLETDYSYTRTNFYDLIENGSKAIESALHIAQEGQHPRAYEVLAQLLKNVGETNEKLLTLHMKMDEMKSDRRVQNSTQVTNNALFVGSTSELQQMIKGNKNGESGSDS